MRSIHLYWLVLIGITLSLAFLDGGRWGLAAILLTIIKVLCVSEHFMGLKHASRLWRAPLIVYGIAVPLGCGLMIYL